MNEEDQELWDLGEALMTPGMMEKQEFPRISFTACWSDELGEEIKKRSTEPYPIDFKYNTPTFKFFAKAVNQGIDSHLEAIFFENKIDFKFTIRADCLHVLVRRLMEADDAYGEPDSNEDTPVYLASGICDTLGIELI